MNYTKLSYLNLEINNPIKRIITLDKQKHTCYIRETDYKHKLHSEVEHMNSLTDLVIELSENLKYYNEKHYNLMQLVLESIIEKNKLLKQISNNQDYLKSNLHKIDDMEITLRKLTEKFKVIKLKEFPNKNDIINLKNLIEENKPKDIEIHLKKLITELKEQTEKDKNQSEEQIRQIEKTLSEIKKLILS